MQSRCRFWIAQIDPSAYRDIYAIPDIYQYYLKFAADYEDVMRGWGYCMPEVTADAIEKHGGIKDKVTLESHLTFFHYWLLTT